MARAPHQKISHSELGKVFSLNIVEAQYYTLPLGRPHNVGRRQKTFLSQHCTWGGVRGAWSFCALSCCGGGAHQFSTRRHIRGPLPLGPSFLLSLSVPPFCPAPPWAPWRRARLLAPFLPCFFPASGVAAGQPHRFLLSATPLAAYEQTSRGPLLCTSSIFLQ